MKSLGEILKKQMPQMPAWKQVTATLVVEKANEAIKELIGENAAKFAQAVYYKDRLIAITCLSSVMAQEIKLNEKKIIVNINNKLGGPARLASEGVAGRQTVEKIRYLA